MGCTALTCPQGGEHASYYGFLGGAERKKKIMKTSRLYTNYCCRGQTKLTWYAPTLAGTRKKDYRSTTTRITFTLQGRLPGTQPVAMCCVVQRTNLLCPSPVKTRHELGLPHPLSLPQPPGYHSYGKVRCQHGYCSLQQLPTTGHVAACHPPMLFQQ